MTEGWVSLRAYAAHRGDSLAAVQKAVKSGRVLDDAVQRDERGYLCAINVALADVQWARHTDPDEAMRNGKVPGSVVALDAPVSVGDAPVVPTVPAVKTDADDYLTSRALKEKFLAEDAKLNHLERVGLLCAAGDVRAEYFMAFREMRDALEQCAARLSSKLVAETDPQRIETMIRNEIRKGLSDVAKQFGTGDAATAGAGECSAVGA